MEDLEPLPESDGAEFQCTLLLNVPERPWAKRCPNKASGLLVESDYQLLIKHRVNLGGRLICADHYEAALLGELERG